MVEYGKYCMPKIREHLRLCQSCSTNKIEDEQHLMLNCTLDLNEIQYLLDSVSHKYPNFHSLSANISMILFFFTNAYPLVFKKLDHFIFLAFEKRESRTLNVAAI